MEWRCWYKLLFILVFISTLNGNVISQNIDHIYISDSIACDTFPPPRNLDGYTQDFAIKIWWEVPLLPDTSKFYFQKRFKQHAGINRNVRTVNVTDHGSKDMWDIQALFPCGGQGGEYGVETDGNYIWTSKPSANNGTFFQYEREGIFNGPVTVPGCQGVYDMAYHDYDGLFYGSNASNTVWGINFYTLTIDNTIIFPTTCRAIAYDSEEDGFWCNNWDTDISLIDMSGSLITSFPLVGIQSFSGLAYDPWTDPETPYLWGFSSDGSGAELVQMNLNAGGTQIFSIDITPIIGGSNAPGGLYTHCELYNLTKSTIGGMRQDEFIFALELGECPGAPLSVIPENLIGYNLYRNDDFLNYIEYDGDDTTTYWDLTLFYPDLYCYTVTALYDLGACGLPGDTGISIFEGPYCAWGGYEFILPFVENWNMGSFDPNLWDADPFWSIEGSAGNPEPSAKFTAHLFDTNYHRPLISNWINCRDHPGTMDPYVDGDLWLEFDIKLDNNIMSGNELLTVQLSDSIEWETIHEFSNSSGSFDWQFNKIDITGQAKGHMIRIAFVAEGENAIDINSWYIDNIMVYRQCNPPLDLHWLVFDESMAWSPPLPHSTDQNSETRELLGYDVYEITQFLEFTTDTFYVLDQSYGYGPYYVTAVYEDCEPASNPIYGPTEINVNEKISEINIFPNPADQQITIKANENITHLSLADLAGKVLIIVQASGKQQTVNTSTLRNGIYILELETQAGMVKRKVVVCH